MTGKHMEYLTEKDLERLVLELEQGELVSAPPDMLDDIMDRLEQETPERQMRKRQEKIVAYKRYRFQVLTTVAAAVLAVVFLPKLADLQQQKKDFVEHKYEYEIQVRYETKEEALNDRGLLEKVLGGENIFKDNSRWNLFKE